MKRMTNCRSSYWRLFPVLIAAVVLAAFAFPGATFAGKSTTAGATLQASKTIDICDTGTTDVNGNPIWVYSGEVSVWNEGVAATQGLKIYDCIQQKNLSGPNFTDRYCATLTDLGAVTIPGFTPAESAITFPYSFTNLALGRVIRNDAKVTITNHSAHIGTPYGPEPKATYTGTVPPPLCFVPCGCSYTQGYWGNKPGVVWPNGFDRNNLFFNSGLTWQQLLDASAGGNGYIILAKQYIAAALNAANGACTPEGIFGPGGTFALAESFFSGTTTPDAACPLSNSCGLQKTWGQILDDYNNGLYPGGPAHCGDE